MTASAETASQPVGPDVLRRLPLAPAEGWVTVGLVVLMAFTLAWAISDVRYVLNRAELTSFLPWAAVGGVGAGLLAAKAGWPRWFAHLAGAIAAALVLPLLVGTVLLDGWASPGELYRTTAASAASAAHDLIVLNRPLTRSIGHHLLALGILCWGSGHYVAYAVFRHRRPLDAVVVLGLVLLANMALTRLDQLGQLIVFSMAALFLLTRSHAFEEHAAWVRRRIGDPAAVRALYLRGGTAFVLAAIVGSLVLTVSASSAPLQGAWADMPTRLIELSRHLQRYLPGGGQTRPIGVAFGPTATIGGIWSPSNTPALTLRVPDEETTRFYWRAVVYDRFDFNAWSWSDERTTRRAPDEPFLAGLIDDPARSGRRELTFIASLAGGYASNFLVSPQMPVRGDHEATLLSVGDEGFFGAIRSDARDYALTALVPREGDEDPLALTENKLRVAGSNYPAEVRARYLDVAPDVIGESARALLAEIRTLAGADNAYDLARFMATYLRDESNFSYDTDVTDLPCNDLSTVECFARFRRGYCEYYATTMAILLREAGIPTRLAEGFLPGERSPRGIERILSSAAHAWVEVYFPTYGWVNFDPTGGPIRPADALPPGVEVSAPPISSLPVPTFRGGDGGAPTVSPGTSGTAPVDGNGPSSGPFVAVAVLLAVAVAGVAFAAWQRGPREVAQPDDVWRGIARLAARFGFGPRPTETVYEYAGSLGEVLPGARPELAAVAQAKVEVAYGRRHLPEDRLRALREAQRRLRLSLLRLAVRRRGRRRR